MENKQFLEYSDTEIDFLKAKDPVLGKAIDEIGHVRREVIPDIFLALINSIIGQQISTKAQETIWRRFLDMFAPVTPEKIAALPVETIQTCGISMKKASYIQEIAASIMDGSLDLEELQAMPDADVCKRLSQIKGIGVWTAEMLMIFSMQRTDIISWGDMAILRGLRMLYRHRKITPQLFEKYKKRYSPYATIASLYLWQISHGACDGLVDLAPKTEARKKTAPKKSDDMKQYKLMDESGNFYYSPEPGLFGGYRRKKIYGRLDCKSANSAIAKGGYIKYRVFFKDEETAIKAGYRPCAKCMPEQYTEWKKHEGKQNEPYL